MERIKHNIKRIITSAPIMATIVSTLIMIAALMIHPLIGVADNGDFYRSTNGQGIYKLNRTEPDQYFNYFSSKYGLYQYYNETEESIVSAHNLYIQAAKLLNSIFNTEKDIFDIRYLSVFLIIELAVAIYMLVDYITYQKGWKEGLVLGTICVIMFTDTAYTAYFNSFYAEGIVYVSCLLLLASALLLTQKRYPPYLLLGSVIVNGLILICTKQQNATEGLVLFFLCIFLAFGISTGKKHFKKIAIGGALFLGFAGIMMYVLIPETFVYMNQYHAMTRGITMTADNPEEALGSFGINKQYAVLDETIYFEKYPAVDLDSERLQDDFYSKYGFVSVTAYYLAHPQQLMTILNTAANNGYMIRPEAQGNYEKSAGKEPGAKTNFFTFYSAFKMICIPNTIGFVIIWMIAIGLLSMKDLKKMILLICAIFIGIIQIGTSIIGAGDADLSKHIFLYNVAFDFVSFISFAPILTGITKDIFQKSNHIFQKKKMRKKTITGMLLLLTVFFLCPTEVNAAPKEADKQVAIICRNEEEINFLQALALTCGMEATTQLEKEYDKKILEHVEYVITTSKIPVEDITQAGLQAVYLGKKFEQIPNTTLEEYQNASVRISYEDYQEKEKFEKELMVITSTEAKEIGKITISGQVEFPFAVLAENGCYYIPFYREEGLSAVLIGTVLQELTGNTEAGKMYFLLDEVYPFSDLNVLCERADTLYENGIPFLARIMPVYENLDYPAFKRYAQVLRYLQSKDGTIVIHPPIVISQQSEREPLADKMKRFEQALIEEKLHYRDFTYPPYLFTWEELQNIETTRKNFGVFSFDTMFGVTPETSEEEFQILLKQMNEKWLSLSDYTKEFTNQKYIYHEEAVEEDFDYREKQEVAFTLFFSASDKILMIVVGVSLLILLFFLLVGRKAYRKKFYK